MTTSKWILYKNGNRADCPALATTDKAYKLIASIESFARQLGHAVRPLMPEPLSNDFGLIETDPLVGEIEYRMKYVPVKIK